MSARSSNAPATLPGIENPVAPDIRPRDEIFPPWAVILHNDDVHDMLYVVGCLMKAVPALSRQAATEIMLAAHSHGRARVTTAPREHAEMYRDRLEGFGLTATLEKL